MADIMYPLRLPADMYGQVKDAAAAADQSAARWIREAIRAKLKAT
ncbi:MAG TPA: hypothetical protein VNO54_06750 [Streptosporangiaceae bacterium]|nr:hypothetical protein [Streptosporangiaceae bacterium]